MEHIAIHPRKRIFYWVAMLLAIAALFLYGTARDAIMQYEVREARMLRAIQEHIPYAGNAETIRMAHAGYMLTLAGWICTGGGIVCMAIAGARQEKGRYLILFGLLMFGFMSSLLL
jgi:hypothetical protein